MFIYFYLKHEEYWHRNVVLLSETKKQGVQVRQDSVIRIGQKLLKKLSNVLWFGFDCGPWTGDMLLFKRMEMMLWGVCS